MYKFAWTFLLTFSITGCFSALVFAAQDVEPLMLHGAPVKSKVSGFKGTPVEVSVNDNEHAMDGISSVEKNDQPCWLWVGTENINNASQDSGAIVDRCGGTAHSRSMKIEYRDTMRFGPRVFVTGIRVCMNNKGNRIKGFQFRGGQVQDDGRLTTLRYPDSGSGQAVTWLTGGSWDSIKLADREQYRSDSQYPADFRNNCKAWKTWADCPYPNQVATGVIAHFEAGKKPRAITGLALQCRYISKLYTGSGS